MKKIMLIFGLIIFGIGILFFVYFTHQVTISGIESYDKKYYINKYSGDLDSSLEIFPDDISNLIDATFISSFRTNLFDSDGYIILSARYNMNDFNNEINRLSKINITISDCNKNTYTNHIKYDDIDYVYPAYITIDGFAHTYEYALINKSDLEIIYVYLSYPDKNNLKYKKYLKKDKSEYSKTDTLDLYSIYNHSFDKGKSFTEYGDCQN